MCQHDSAQRGWGPAVHDRHAEPSGPLWLEVRDHELREIDRERALRRLLLDVSQTCATASDVDAVTRSVLVRVVMGLDAVEAWVELGEDGPVFASSGEVPAPEAVRAVVRAAQQGTAGEGCAVLDETATAELPAESAGRPALYVPFRFHGPAQGSLLVVVDPIPRDADGALAAVTTFLGMAVARVRALEALRRLNRQLEVQVRRRTADLQREKEGLEVRVRERTAELERAKLAALEAERVMLDRERVEGVHQLAAGLAHEINNPLGALRGALEFLRDELASLQPGEPVPPELFEELKEAVRDGIADSERMATLVTSLFGRVAESRKAAVRTDLNAAVREALDHFRVATPGGWNLAANLGPDQAVGIPHAELTRWIFRLLSAVATADPRRVRVRTTTDVERPVLEVRLPLDVVDAPPDLLAALVHELHGADVVTHVTVQENTRVLSLAFPPGCGSRLHDVNVGGGR